MKLSYNWISDYVDLSGIEIKDLVNRLTLSTCEVEEIEPSFPDLSSILVAEIVSTEKHPQADKLQLCDIRAGKFKGKIVCGAPNARPGILVPFAPVGAKIPGKDGAGLQIQKAAIRGIESEGMLCSALELGLDKLFAGDGLLELDAIVPGIAPGTSLSTVIPHDWTITIDNKSITNRPDLWCHFGFAREISAVYKKKLKFNPLEAKVKVKPAKLSKKIKIESGSALAYFGAVCENVQVTPTPLWMRLRLAAVGQKSINNVVDVSNYAMLELAQPNHLFDLSTLKESTVSVALNQTHGVKSFKTLDGESRNIPDNTILIFDGENKGARAVALGGIMGGEDSAIQPTTQAIFIESATFPRELIRRSLKRIDLRTDSAMRFEKGQDPAKAKPTITRIVSLLQETNPAIAMGPITGTSVPATKSKIKATLAFLQTRLGFAVSRKEVETTLSWLGFGIQADKSGKTFSITAPTYRSQYDISIPEDIVEELGRIHGYDHIAPVPLVVPVLGKSLDHTRLLERRWRRFLVDAGFTETLSYSFCNREDNQLFGSEGIELLNSLAGLTHLKTALLPGVLRHLGVNQDRYAEVDLFETGRAYADKLHADGEKAKFLHAAGPAREEKRFCIARMLPEKLPLTAQEDELVKFRELVRTLAGLHGRDIEIVLANQASNWPPLASANRLFHPSCSMALLVDGTAAGILGVIHPAVAEAYSLKRPVLIAEISFDRIASEHRRKKYVPPSVFPDSLFELTLILDEVRSAQDPVNVIRSLKIEAIHSIELLGIYRGAPIAEGKKSASYRIRCRKADGTFSQDEWKKVYDSVIEALAGAGIPLRS